MLTEAAVHRLTGAQRLLLIQHIDVAVPVDVTDQPRNMTRKSLMALGLLRGEPANVPKSRETVLTQAGRHAVGVLLGHYADALVAAGFLEPVDSGEVREKLRVLKKRWSTAGRIAPLAVPAKDARRA